MDITMYSYDDTEELARAAFVGFHGGDNYDAVEEDVKHYYRRTALSVMRKARELRKTGAPTTEHKEVTP